MFQVLPKRGLRTLRKAPSLALDRYARAGGDNPLQNKCDNFALTRTRAIRPHSFVNKATAQRRVFKMSSEHSATKKQYLKF